MRVELQEINATPETIKTVQLLRTGRFSHGSYGNFDITTDTLLSLKRNFDTNIRRVKLAVDYFHDAYEEAAGWITEVNLLNANNELWIKVEWTPKAEEMILAKEVRYISADLDFEYEDSETRKQYGATLLGAGLTNRPHIKDMKAILSDFKPELRQKIETLLTDKKKETIMGFDEILLAVASLTDDQKAQLAEKLGTFKAAEGTKLADAESATATLKALLADKEKSLKEATEKADAITLKLADSEKSASFNVMLAEGKATEGQRESFMSGNIIEFAKNAVKVNLSAAGTGSESVCDSSSSIAKLNEITENIMKTQGVSFAAASKQAYSENKALADNASK